MNVRRLELRNFRSYASLELDLPEGCVAIVGENGAGKSSLLVAIDVALFGAASLEPYRRRGADVLEITVYLDHDGKHYRVRRSYRTRSTLDFEQVLDNGTCTPLTLETQPKTQALIEDRLGLTRDTWRASGYLAQGDSAALSNATPAERMKILRNTIGGLEQYKYAHERAKALLRTAEEEMMRLDVVGGGISSALAELPEVRAENDTLAEQTNRATEDLGIAELAATSAEDRLQAARERLAEARALAAEADATKSRLLSITSQQENGLRAGAALDGENKRAAALELEAAAVEELAEKIEDHNARLRAHEHAVAAHAAALKERSRLTRQANELRGIADMLRARALADKKAGPGKSRCHECGQVLGEEALMVSVGKRREQANDEMARSHDYEQRAAAVDVTEPPPRPPIEEYRELGDALDNARAARMQLGITRDRIGRLREAAERIDSDEFRRTLEEARVSTAAAQAAREAAVAIGAPDLATLERAAGEASRCRRASRGRLDALSQRRAVATHKLERLQAAELQLAELDAERTTLAHDAAVLDVVVAMFSSRGIPLLVIENAVPIVEERAQSVLERLGGQTAGCRIVLQTQRALKGDGSLRDTLEIVIHTPAGDPVPYELWSGGEKMRLDLAIRIGLAQLLLLHGANVEFFCIDEPDGLDVQGRAALVEVIEEMADRFGFSKVLLISHDDSLRDALPQTIEVARGPNGSGIMAAA